MANSSQKTEIAELVDLTREAKEEAAKAKPNKLKLISAIQGVGAALGLIKALPEAYDALKIGAAHIGVHLP